MTNGLVRRSIVVIGVLLCVAANVAAQWSKTAMPDGGYVFSLAVIDTTLFAGTENGVFTSYDYGASWSPVGFPDTTVRYLFAKDGMLFAGVAGKVLRSSDNGATWISKGPTVKVEFLGSTPDGLWASASMSWSPYRELLFSSDYGDHWQVVGGESGAYTCPYLYGVAANSRHLFLATTDGVYISERSGASFMPWYLSQLGMPYGPYGVFSFILSDTDLYAGSWGAGLHRSQDLATFQSLPNAGLTSANIHALLADGSYLFAGTQTGIFRSSDRGANWTVVGLPNTDVYALVRVGLYLFAGAASGVSQSSDGGLTWSDMHTGLRGRGALCLLSQGDTLLLGTQSGLFRSIDKGTSWAKLGLPNEFVLTLVQDGSDLYAGARSGLYRSTDNGLTWTALASGLTQSTYCLYVSPTVMLRTGYYCNGFYRSTDHGLTWTFIQNVPSQLVQFAKVGSTVIASAQGVYRSSDDGATWSFDWNNSMSLRLIWDLAVRGNDLYAASGNQVFVSSDEGLTWTSVSTGLTGYQAEHLTLYGTDLYASTYEGIAVLSPNATAWTPVNMEGLTHTRIGALAVTSTDFFAIAGGWGEAREGGREIWSRPISQVVCCDGTTGNVNLAGVVDLADLSALVSYLTGGGYVLPCPSEANVNGAGIVDLADLSALVSYLTGGGYVLSNCS